MRNGLLATTLSIATLSGIWLAGAAALAQEPAPAAGECFPKCRTGYFCQAGACVSLCNPPCADDERCTAEGECVLKAPAAPPPAAPEAPRAPRYTPHLGAVLGLTGGGTTCTASVGCDTAGGDLGAYASLRGGYRALPWLVVDADLAFAPLFLKSAANVESTFLFAAGLGARLLPLARRRGVDPVLGLHLGYALQHVKAADDVIERWQNNALYLAYSAGLSFNFERAPLFSLTVSIDVIEPFWLSTCTTTKPVAGNPATGAAAQEAATSCAGFTGDHDQLFFGVGLGGNFWL